MCNCQKAWEVEDQCDELKRNAWAMRREDLEDKEKRRQITGALARFDNDAQIIRDEIREVQGFANMACPDGAALDRLGQRRRFHRLPPSRLPRLPGAGRPLEGTCTVVKEAAQQRLAALQNERAIRDRTIAARRAELNALDERLRRRNEEWDRGVREFRRLGCEGNL